MCITEQAACHTKIRQEWIRPGEGDSSLLFFQKVAEEKDVPKETANKIERQSGTRFLVRQNRNQNEKNK